MNHKKQKLIFAVTLTVVFMLCIWTWRKQTAANQTNPSANAKTVSPQSIPTSAPSSNTDLAKHATAMAKWDKIFSHSINIYGKVVDEKGLPVEGARVRYAAPSSILDIEKGSIDGPITDANGLFSITGKRGAGINIIVSHANYYGTDKSYGDFSFFEDTERNPTREKPAVFMLQKKGTSEPMLRIKQIVRSVPKDGRPIQIGLSSKRAAEITLSVLTSAPLEPSRRNAPFAWKMRLAVPGGGLIVNDDPYQFQAPENGYNLEVEFAMPAEGIARKWRDDFEQTYFVKLSNGHFARMRFQMVAGGGHFAVVESYYNPQPGSRNLEYDPEKAVKRKN